MSYGIKMRSETVTANKTFNEKQYGGWLAMNIGANPAKVYGIELQPGEGLSSESIMHLNPGDTWEEPIEIEITQPGAVRLLRTIATPKSR